MNALRNPRLRATFISILAGSGILILKFIAYRMTGSAALKSDAYEGVVNVVAAAFALGAILFAEQPTDKDHPYGHGKIEHFSAAFEGGLISLAAILIIYEGVLSWVSYEPLKRLDLGLAVTLVSGLLNGALGWYLMSRGRALKSAALEADGHHVLSDFYTTVGLIAGVGVVWLTELRWLDSVIAIAMGLWLLRTGFLLVKRASGALLDLEDPATLKSLVAEFNNERPNEIITMHGLRTLRSGRHTHVDVHLVIPEYLPIKQAHTLVEDYGRDVLKRLGMEGEFHSHVDPCYQAYCGDCTVQECAIRRVPSSGRKQITVEEATVPEVDEILG
jgi:cation diffusion facilitator family transporter